MKRRKVSGDDDEQASMAAIKVLLVDDEADFAEILAGRLRTRGFSVATASSGDEALEKLSGEDFQVVLLDLVMPGRDGLETLREIKFSKPLTEVIILSGKGTEGTAVEGMNYGAFDFLTKPPDIADLTEKIGDAHIRQEEHLARIREALDAGREAGTPVVERVALAQAEEAPCISGDGVPRQGRLLVFGRQDEFSDALIEYALDMAGRLSYEVLALNASGFSPESFRAFPAARLRVFRNFQRSSEENAIAFREAAAKRDIPFSHVVKFSGLDEATREVRQEVGEIDFVVFEPSDEMIGPAAEPGILVYSPV